MGVARFFPGAARVSPESSPHFSRRLYDFISKESSSLGAFPLRPGTHRDLRAPQLELLSPAVRSTLLR